MRSHVWHPDCLDKEDTAAHSTNYGVWGFSRSPLLYNKIAKHKICFSASSRAGRHSAGSCCERKLVEGTVLHQSPLALKVHTKGTASRQTTSCRVRNPSSQIDRAHLNHGQLRMTNCNGASLRSAWRDGAEGRRTDHGAPWDRGAVNRPGIVRGLSLAFVEHAHRHITATLCVDSAPPPFSSPR